ncbi:MAG: SMR family transporter [Alcaligenaceae bacterium]|nr:SMR family transporter [Alcaligenaceae bacterium]
MTAYLLLAIAIFFEIAGTGLLIKTEQFTRLIPSVLVLSFYGASFYFLSLSLKYIPIGIAYALWSAVGIVGITLIGFIFFKQRLDLPAILGIALIIVGVVVINLFSKSVSHG